MFNRIKRGYAPRTRSNTPQYSTCQTSQLEPNLHDILVAYQHGEDVSEYIRIPAVKATAEQQFTNRIGKVDPLTEIHDYVANEVKTANELVKKERSTRSKVVIDKEPSENSETKSE